MSSKKVLLVTGATSGIGAATAELMAKAGWSVAVSGRRADKGAKVAEDIKAAGGEATFFQSDVSTEKGVKDLVEQVIAKYGQLDAAVNNAGISLDDSRFADCSTEKFEKMINTNILGVFWCMQQQIKAMLPRKSGAIVNLASMAGLNGIPLSSTYAATKHAVVGLTKSAALDYAELGIRVNAVAPGAIRTDILNYAIESGAYPVEAIEAMFPMNRMGKPIDIAKGIAFLIENDYCTGTILSVDGGFNAK